jgi:hypothetical protein
MWCVRRNLILRNGFMLLRIPCAKNCPCVRKSGHIREKFIRSQPKAAFNSAVTDRRYHKPFSTSPVSFPPHPTPVIDRHYSVGL